MGESKNVKAEKRQHPEGPVTEGGTEYTSQRRRQAWLMKGTCICEQIKQDICNIWYRPVICIQANKPATESQGRRQPSQWEDGASSFQSESISSSD